MQDTNNSGNDIYSDFDAAASRKWRIGVVDYKRKAARGGHGIEEAFMGLPNVEICAVADCDEPSRVSLLEDTGAPKMFADWRDMIAEEKPDVICMCSRHPNQHAEVVIGAAEAGCHIYCEKPFATTLAETDAMIAAAESNNVKLAVAHLARYSEPFYAAKKLVDGGKIGKPLMAYCRGKEDDRGGGEDMITLGTHLFDIVRFLFGDPKWVFGHVGRDGRDMVKSDARQPTEPVGTVAGNEIVATFGFENNFHCLFESRHDRFVEGKPWHFGLIIVGTEGKLAFRYGEGERVLRMSHSTLPFEEPDSAEYEKVTDIITPVVPGAVPFGPEKSGTSAAAYYAGANRRGAWDLLCAATTDRQPICSGNDARWSLEMIHGVYTSHLAAKRIDLPLVNRNHPLD